MPTEENLARQNLLSHYGVSIAEYCGEGVLTLRNGKKVNCNFRAGQLASGHVLLLCDFSPPLSSCLTITADKFEGMTSEGSRISGEVIAGINYLPRDRLGICMAFWLREMSVQMTKHDVEPLKARFGVTNFEFTGIQPSADSSCLILPFSLQYAASAADLSIIPLSQYSSVIECVKTLRGVDITCEVLGGIPKDGGLTRLTEVVDDLCYLLSVARGTKVQWIYRDLYSKDDGRLLRAHYSRVTKPFCPLPVIDPRAKYRHETKVFIEQAYPIYTEKREAWRLNRETIDAYLDAKVEVDYLQMRAVKLAVAMEIIKSAFLELLECPIAEHNIAVPQFKKLKPLLKEAIGEVLKAWETNKKLRSAVYGKLEELNRVSFADILARLCEFVQLEVEKQDLDLFIACRNKLIHKGSFYCDCAKPEERKKCRPLPSGEDEYFFLLNFCDKILLRLLGYSGSYVNWRTPGKPVRDVV